MKFIHLGIVVLLATSPVFAQSPKPIISCLLSDGTRASLVAELSADGKRLFVNLDKKTQPAFTDMPDTDFFGVVIMAKCAPSSLIFALNYGSPYLKGVVLRKTLSVIPSNESILQRSPCPAVFIVGKSKCGW
ncbi:hypothetical protein [Pseudomonas mandelii]|uniref:hypothetical protein n=1 Tax=Pseudomonas mandelii TaxID=75612 RepID=UPI0020A20E61|nr:hypothetical protein [Pseudomonas mandelii]MCO8314275.1 hypothetical protein [Pseudomonas mandelii]